MSRVQCSRPGFPPSLLLLLLLLLLHTSLPPPRATWQVSSHYPVLWSYTLWPLRILRGRILPNREFLKTSFLAQETISSSSSSSSNSSSMREQWKWRLLRIIDTRIPWSSSWSGRWGWTRRGKASSCASSPPAPTCPSSTRSASSSSSPPSRPPVGTMIMRAWRLAVTAAMIPGLSFQYGYHAMQCPPAYLRNVSFQNICGRDSQHIFALFS